jgi:hypothetical protein
MPHDQKFETIGQRIELMQRDHRRDTGIPGLGLGRRRQVRQPAATVIGGIVRRHLATHPIHDIERRTEHARIGFVPAHLGDRHRRHFCQTLLHARHHAEIVVAEQTAAGRPDLRDQRFAPAPELAFKQVGFVGQPRTGGTRKVVNHSASVTRPLGKPCCQRLADRLEVAASSATRVICHGEPPVPSRGPRCILRNRTVQQRPDVIAPGRAGID